MRYLTLAGLCAALAGCAITSPVMDAGSGVYLISSHASAIRGGATGASSIAYEDAQKYCAAKGGGLHAVVLTENERDVYQSSFGGSFNANGGNFGGASLAAGNVNLRFNCAP